MNENVIGAEARWKQIKANVRILCRRYGTAVVQAAAAEIEQDERKLLETYLELRDPQRVAS